MKRVFIVHRWDGSPKSDWYPWLKKELERKNIEVHIPAFPNPGAPKVAAWVSHLEKAVKKPDKKTFFVGHSIGCQAILRYLENIKEEVGGVLFVAGWFALSRQATVTKEEKEIAHPWIQTPINLKRIRQKKNTFVALFSDNDPYVPIENASVYEQLVGAKIFIEKNQGHFSEHDGVTSLPLGLKILERIGKF